MAPVVSALEQQLAASQSGPAPSPAAAAFRTVFLPAAAAALGGLRKPHPQLLLSLTRPAAFAGVAEGGPAAVAAAGAAAAAEAAGGEELAAVWAPFKALQERLHAQLRGNRLELAQVWMGGGVRISGLQPACMLLSGSVVASLTLSAPEM